MKTFLKNLLILGFTAVTTAAFSQGPPPKEKARQEKQDNIESMKIAYLTSKLDLTPEEAQKFWPVYNQYSDKLHELRKKRKQEGREAKKNFDELTDKEIDQAIENDFAFRQKELDIQKEYDVKFRSVLPIRKVSLLYHAEEQFKRVLIDKLKDNRKGPPEKGN